MRLIPPHKLQLAAAIAVSCKVLNKEDFCARTFPAHSFVVRSFPFLEFFSAAICLKWSPLCPSLLSRASGQSAPRGGELSKSNRAVSTTGKLRRIFRRSVLSSPAAVRPSSLRNKMYASNLQLHRIRLPLKYLPSSHYGSKFEHNKRGYSADLRYGLLLCVPKLIIL